MTGFPINPPRAPIADATGNIRPEWYRFFAQIQTLIGTPGGVLDEANLLLGPRATLDLSAIAADAALLIPPVVIPAGTSASISRAKGRFVYV